MFSPVMDTGGVEKVLDPEMFYFPKQHSQMSPSRAQPGPNWAQPGPNRDPHGMLLGLYPPSPRNALPVP